MYVCTESIVDTNSQRNHTSGSDDLDDLIVSDLILCLSLTGGGPYKGQQSPIQITPDMPSNAACCIDAS